jgi:WD40 repeat protein
VRNRKVIRPPSKSAIAAIAFAPDGSLAALGQFPDEPHPAVTLWQVPDFTPVRQVDARRGEAALRLSFSTVGNSLAIVYSSSELVISEIEDNAQQTIKSEMPIVDDARFAPNADRIVVCGSGLEVRSHHGRQAIWALGREAPDDSPDAAPIAADISPDGTLVAAVIPGVRGVGLYEPDRRRQIGTLSNAPSGARMVRFDPTGRFVAAVDANGGAAHLWDLKQRQKIEIDVFSLDLSEYLSVAFDREGKRMALGSVAGVITVISIPHGRVVLDRRLVEGRIWDVAFSPITDHLLVGAEDGIARWVALS